MSLHDAEAISNWHCNDRWSVYDLNGRVPAIVGSYPSVKARSDDGDLIGFFCTGSEARVPGIDEIAGTLDLGWGPRHRTRSAWPGMSSLANAYISSTARPAHHTVRRSVQAPR